MQDGGLKRRLSHEGWWEWTCRDNEGGGGPTIDHPCVHSGVKATSDEVRILGEGCSRNSRDSRILRGGSALDGAISHQVLVSTIP
ncbi:MAG: hypothetical protein C3F08_00705 [Candidatus Methylomirabilota bacterium]|nr:MAG: hypothetical protein C3F08_00705 [candidate division NC10 bacterium]